jgi:hypothetical protein
MAAKRDRGYGARVNVMSLYGRLEEQGLRCKCKCNEFVWHLTRTVFMEQGELF